MSFLIPAETTKTDSSSPVCGICRMQFPLLLPTATDPVFFSLFRNGLLWGSILRDQAHPHSQKVRVFVLGERTADVRSYADVRRSHSLCQCAVVVYHFFEAQKLRTQKPVTWIHMANQEKGGNRVNQILWVKRVK